MLPPSFFSLANNPLSAQWASLLILLIFLAFSLFDVNLKSILLYNLLAPGTLSHDALVFAFLKPMLSHFGYLNNLFAFITLSKVLAIFEQMQIKSLFIWKLMILHSAELTWGYSAFYLVIGSWRGLKVRGSVG